MKKFFPIMLLALLLAGCHPSQTAMDDLQSFTERIEQKSDRWSEADWDDAAMHYSEICQTIERYDYTDEQLREIGRLKGRCLAHLATFTPKASSTAWGSKWRIYHVQFTKHQKMHFRVHFFVACDKL